MAHRLRLVVLALAALAASSAHAGYAQLATPSGFGGSPAAWTFAASANDTVFDRVIHQPNGLKVPVPGTPTTMSASYRLAANAPRIAAAAIFANPYVRVGVGIATWLGVSKVVWDSVDNIWREEAPQSQTDGFEYRHDLQPWRTSANAACSDGAALYAASTSGRGSLTILAVEPGRCMARKTFDGVDYGIEYISYDSRQAPVTNYCPPGWTPSGAGCLSPQLTQPQMVELLNPANQPGWPMPSTVPQELPPGTPLPVEPPVINPAPGPNPLPRPLFVPTGDPVPNPNYDPNSQPSPTNQPYNQPGVRVVPSPTASEPWRVDLQPTNRPVPNPDPAPEPIPEDVPNPGDKPKPEEQQSLCEKHPDVVACAKIGTVEAVPVANERKQLSISKDTGYGPESGTCPAPKTVTVMGRTLEFKYDLLCDFAGYIKPLLIAFAWLSAALTFFGFSRKDS